jgi:hypothetical protein
MRAPRPTSPRRHQPQLGPGTISGTEASCDIDVTWRPVWAANALVRTGRC